MNIATNYQMKLNNQAVQSNLAFGNKQKIVAKGVEKVLPAVAAALVPAATVLAMQNGVRQPKEVQTIYGPLRYIPSTGEGVKSSLVVSRPNGSTMDIFEGIPQETLETPVASHIHQINSSTINPKVGIVITQNQSKPVVARKISTEGTLENSLVENNSNNIPLKYDTVTGTQYADTPWNPGRQDITGNCLQVTYGTVKEDWGARPYIIA